MGRAPEVIKNKILCFHLQYPVFSYQEFEEWKAGQGITNNNSLHTALRYYVKKGRLLRLRRKLYAVIPPNSSSEAFQADSYLR